MRIIHSILSLILIGLWACTPQPKQEVHLPSKNYHYIDINVDTLYHSQKVYVPVYSDIYHSSDARRFLLTATLSVRNTSLRDTMYVSEVDYYDSQGNLTRNYLKQTIFLHPLESVEFVVEYKEDKGGAGANFIVHWGTDSPVLKPVIQAVMIGTASQQGISFVTEGVVIEAHHEQDSVILPD